MSSRSIKKQRVLLVGMADSIHLARWILQFTGLDFQFELVSSSPHRSVHPVIREMLSGSHPAKINIRMSKISRYFSLPLWLADRVFKDALRGGVIRRAIRMFKPEIVHALELQNAGYASAAAYKWIKDENRPKLLITNYGSEIVWFKQFPRHLKKLKQLVALADAFSAECDRDVRLAKEIGFKGKVMRTIPVSGGVDLNEQMVSAKLTRSDERYLIAVKGYQNVWGQALIALDAISKVAPHISDYEVEVFSCNRKTIKAAKAVSQKTGLRISTHKKKSLTHPQVLEILRKSRVYIGLSKSDGISTSMIEAMSQGAVPIQSNTSCGNEWIRDGLDGFLVPYDDATLVAERLLYILDNPEFAQQAQKTNFDTIAAKYDSAKLSKVASGYYSELAR